MCLTAIFQATVGFKFKLFKNACMVHKHATVLLLHSAFMLSMVKMPLKREVGGHALNSHGKDLGQFPIQSAQILTACG